MKRFLAPLLAALIGIGFAAWWFSPDQVLKRRTVRLLETLTLQRDQGKAGRQLNAYGLNALLANHVTLDSPEFPEASGEFDSVEIESAFSWLCEHALETRFTKESIESIERNEDSAMVRCVLSALVVLPTHRPADGTYVATFHWKQSEEGWRLERAEWDRKRN